MTTVKDCKEFSCDNYYSQCPHCRVVRIDRCKVLCEDYKKINDGINDKNRSTNERRRKI